MGNDFGSPYAFRRAVTSLHASKHPAFDVGNGGNEEDVKKFWRALFRSRLSAVEFASFWTARDVRLLRMFHPDRLAAVLLAAIQQIDAFLIMSTTNSHGGGSGGGSIGPVTSFGSSAVRVDVREWVSYMQDVPNSASRKGDDAAALPLDFTAVMNALCFISGSLPYCFEDIEKLRALLDEDEAASDEQDLSIAPHLTRNLVKSAGCTVSPFAEDFAYHFFVRGDACVNSSCSPASTTTTTTTDGNDVGQTCYPPLLGAHLIEVLIQLLFVPSFTTILPRRTTSPLGRTGVSSEDLEGLEFLSELYSTMTANGDEATVTGSVNGSSTNAASELVQRMELAAALKPLNDERRAMILRTILLALSGVVFSPQHRAKAAVKPGEEYARLDRSVCRREKTAAVMASALFGGRRKSLSVLLCISLLHVVRCYPKRSAPSLLTWVRDAHLTAAHIAVLGYAISILVLGLYAGPTVSSCCVSLCEEEEGKKEDPMPNAFWEFLHAVVGQGSSSVFGGVSLSGNVLDTRIPSQAVHSDNRASCYVEDLVEGLLALLDCFVRASEEKMAKAPIPCAPLALQLLLWLLQESPVALDIVGGRPQLLMAFIHSLCVSSTISSSRFGEGQLALLCLLILARHPPFLRLLMTPLPSATVGATKAEVSSFLRTIRAVIPMLPQNLIIGGEGEGGAHHTESVVSSDTLCIRKYLDLLVLSLCFVASPSSPWWFQALYRSAVEVLHTVQVCLPRSNLPGIGVHSLCDLLSEHVVLELVSSLNYLTSPQVVKCGSDVQRACEQMIHVVLNIIQASIGPMQMSSGAWRSSIQWVEEQKEGKKLMPLLYNMAKNESASNLMQLAQMMGVVETKSDVELVTAPLLPSSAPMKYPISDKPPASRSCDTSGISHGAASPCDHSREAPLTGGFPTPLQSPTFAGELACLQRIIAAVSGVLGGGVVASLTEFCDATIGEGYGESCCNARDACHPCTPAKMQHEDGDWLQRQLWPILCATAEVLDGEHRRRAEGGGPIKNVPSEKVRHVVTSGKGSGGLWLLAHLWRQIHLFNPSPPIFDYRSASLLWE